MPSITKEQLGLVYGIGFILLVANAVILIPGIIQSYNSNNSTEKLSYTEKSISAIISTTSLFVSFIVMFMTQNSLEKTDKSLKIAENTLNFTETENNKRDIMELLEYFYLPVKDVLEPNCVLLKKEHEINNHSPDNDPNKSWEFALAANLFSRKMEALESEYFSNKGINVSTEHTIIKLHEKESNILLIHLRAIEELKKVKQYRHLADIDTTRLFETYVCWNQNDELSMDKKAYLKQKTTEFSQLSTSVNTSLKNYQEELNKYSKMENN